MTRYKSPFQHKDIVHSVLPDFFGRLVIKRLAKRHKIRKNNAGAKKVRKLQ
jgi:hypothetical protein